MLNKITDLILFKDNHFYAAFPAVATLADGEVVAMFRRARDHRWLTHPQLLAGDPEFESVDHVDARSQLVLLRLGPDLAPLGEPEGLPVDPEAGDQDASLLVLNDGRLLAAGFGWYPLAARHQAAARAAGIGLLGSPETTGCLYLFWGGYTRTSDDGGRSWTAHRYLPPLPGHGDLVPGRRPQHGGAVRGRPVQTSDGTILLASYATVPGSGRYGAHLFASTDRGASWRYRAQIAADPEGKAGYAEPALLLTADGRLIAFLRSFGLGDRLATATSRDFGRSWDAVESHAVIGHPYDALPLPDGRALVVYGFRHKPYGIRARLWRPDGPTPLAETEEFVIRNDGPSPDLGYPWATRLADGRILVVYYFCDPHGVRHIAGSVLSITD